MQSVYPELYVFLDEQPITIPSIENPEITVSVLQDYLANLKQQVNRYLESRLTH